MNTLAERLAAARTDKGLTQEQLAKAAGVAQSTIGSLESGARQSARKITAIANALGVNSLWLAEGKGPRDSGAPAVIGVVTEESRPSHPRLQWVDDQEAEVLSLFRACGPAEKNTSIVVLKSLPKAIGGADRSDQG